MRGRASCKLFAYLRFGKNRIKNAEFVNRPARRAKSIRRPVAERRKSIAYAVVCRLAAALVKLLAVDVKGAIDNILCVVSTRRPRLHVERKGVMHPAAEADIRIVVCRDGKIDRSACSKPRNNLFVFEPQRLV